MCNQGLPATSAFMKQLFDEAVRDGAGTLTLDFGSFGETGRDFLSVGPHPGFEPLSFVMSFRTDHGPEYQTAFASNDVGEVRQLIRAMQGWVAFIEARAALAEEEKS